MEWAQNQFLSFTSATFETTCNTWAQKADFGGSVRYDATGFSIGSKGYLGTGYDGIPRNDFWEYDPATNTWTHKADFGGTARNYATGISIDSKGYIGSGIDFQLGGGNGNYFKDF
jgi:outer membrane protease